MENLKKIPMSTEEIQELFLNSKAHYVVDFKNSALKGESFITYITNMQMSCSLHIDESVPTGQKFELLKLFLTSRLTTKCDTLLHTSALVLLRSRGLGIENSVPWLSFQEMDEFINTHGELLGLIEKFLDSTPLMASSFNVEFKKAVIDPAIQNGEVEIITETTAVSVNVLGLFTVPDFIEFYLSAPPLQSRQKPAYFQGVQEKLIYDKKSLFDLFFKGESSSFLMGLINVMFSNGEEENSAMLNFVNGTT